MKNIVGQVIWGTHPKLGQSFDYAMIVLILTSLGAMIVESIPATPMAVKVACGAIEIAVVLIFTGEYILRLWTSERPLKYVFSFWG